MGWDGGRGGCIGRAGPAGSNRRCSIPGLDCPPGDHLPAGQPGHSPGCAPLCMPECSGPRGQAPGDPPATAWPRRDAGAGPSSCSGVHCAGSLPSRPRSDQSSFVTPSGGGAEQGVRAIGRRWFSKHEEGSQVAGHCGMVLATLLQQAALGVASPWPSGQGPWSLLLFPPADRHKRAAAS